MATALSTLRLELTNRCQLACAHCSVAASRNMHDMMPADKALVLLDQFAEQGGRRLILTGGEPLEHASCLDILERAKALSIGTVLYSMGIVYGNNGVQDSSIERLSHVVDIWQVSLHSADARGHEALTNVRGSFESTCKVVRKAANRGIEVRATFFAYPDNVLEITAVAELCGRLGIRELRVLAAVPQGRAATSAARFDVDGRTLIEQVEKASRVGCTRVRLGEAAKAKLRQPNSCQAVNEELVVNWEGWISPCHSVEPFASESDLDNVLRVSLQRLLANSPRLLMCRALASSRGSGCTAGCIVREALRGPS